MLCFKKYFPNKSEVKHNILDFNERITLETRMSGISLFLPFLFYQSINHLNISAKKNFNDSFHCKICINTY